jgi:hypothetical protein
MPKNTLAAKIEDILTERALAAERSAQLATQVEELKLMVEQMRRRPWWKRLPVHRPSDGR